MCGKDAFSEYHPFINFVYFGLIFGFSMFFMHPGCLLLSLVGAALYAAKVCRGKTVRGMLRFLLPSCLLIVLINPAFNHEGTTLLCYLPSGNPLTLESILYGVAAGSMFAAVLLWFGCFTAVMTSDKFIYLFGKIVPALSLVLSMALRFVPHFRAQLDMVREAQAGIGPRRGEAGSKNRIRSAFSAFSATVTWALENAIETADSMKSRGFGLKGRTSFSIYRFTPRDKYALIWLCFCGLYILCGSLAGSLFWRWYPNVRGVALEPLSVSVQLVYFALCVTPLIIDGREERKWKFLRSGI